MDENPYKAPGEVGTKDNDRTSRPSRIGKLVLTAFIGSALGSVAIAPFIRNPGGPVDPTGSETAFFHGAAIGGILALAMQVTYLLAKDYGDEPA